jgi:hypothetical protein
MKQTTVLVIVDTVDQMKELTHKCKPFVLALNRHLYNRLEGPRTRIIFMTAGTMDTCGLQVDAVINLSTADTDTIRDALGSCLMAWE